MNMGSVGADLSDADLRGADFSLANVAKVIFLLNSENRLLSRLTSLSLDFFFTLRYQV